MSDTPKAYPYSSDKYFAGPETDSTEIGEFLMGHVTRFESFCRKSGLFALWRKAYRFLYNMDDEGYTGYEVGKKGEQGELSVAKFNHIRALRTSALSLATSTMGDMEPQAVNDDYESEVQCRTAKGILQYYDTIKSFEAHRIQAIENAFDLGTGGYFQRWRRGAGGMLVPPLPALTAGDQSGQPIAQPAPGGPGASGGALPGAGPAGVAQDGATSSGVLQGDLEAFPVTAIDIICDPRSKKADTDWNIIRHFENKFDVASTYAPNHLVDVTQGELYDKIVSTSRKPTGHDTFYNLDLAMQLFYAPWDEETDDIPVFYFVHRKTPACPEGRFCVFLASNLVIEDCPLDESGARFRKIQGAPLLDTPFGYTPVFDLLAPQEVIDTMSSIRVTNEKTFGVQGIVAPKGADLEPTQIVAGLTLIEYEDGTTPPAPFQATNTAKEIIQCRKDDILEMGQLIGVSSVVRGDPEASLKSGSALALVQAQSVQFSSQFQRNIQDFTGLVGTDMLEILRAKLDPEREYAILGVDGALELQLIGKDKLSKVKRVIVKAGNPLAATISGRVTMAEMITNMPADERPRMLRLLETGRLEPVTRVDERKEANIRKENEQLMNGIGAPPPPPPPGMNRMQHPNGRPDGVYTVAVLTDDHRAHIREHSAVLDSPAARRDPRIVQAVTSHNQQHLEMLIQLTQNNMPLLEALGQLPLQSAMPPPPMPPGAPPPHSLPPGGPPHPPGPPPPKGIQHHPPHANAAPMLGEPGPADSGRAPKMPQFPRAGPGGDRFTPPPPPDQQ